MKNKHHIIVETERLKYEFDIKRNITVIDVKDLDKILEEPEKYIDSKEFFSWERFFTELLVSATRGNNITKYEKSRLKPFYVEGKNKEAILSVVPEKLRAALLQ